MNEMAGARAHELQQEASLAIVLRIYRCDGRRTRSPESPKNPTSESGGRSEFVPHSGALHAWARVHFLKEL